MIRAAVIEDIPRLVELGRMMHAESRYARLDYATQKVEALLHRLMADGFLVVAQQGERIVGGFAGMISEHWFSHELVAADLALFIEPDARGGMTAPRLVKAFVGWARGKGAAIIQCGITTGVHVEETERLYQAIGGTECGKLFEFGGGDVHRT